MSIGIQDFQRFIYDIVTEWKGVTGEGGKMSLSEDGYAYLITGWIHYHFTFSWLNFVLGSKVEHGIVQRGGGMGGGGGLL